LGWIETESLAFTFGISVAIGGDITFGVTIPYANTVCYSGTVRDCVTFAFAIPCSQTGRFAKRIAFRIRSVFKPGFSFCA